MSSTAALALALILHLLASTLRSQDPEGVRPKAPPPAVGTEVTRPSRQATGRPAGFAVVGYYLHDPARPASAALAPYGQALSGISVWAWGLQADGRLTEDVPAGQLAQVVQSARDLGLESYALVHNYQGAGFDGAAARRLLGDPQAASGAVDAIARQAAALGLSGVTLDLENVPPQARGDLVGFVEALSGRLASQGQRLTVAVPARTADGAGNAYDYHLLARAAHQLWLMTYDQHYRSGPPGPIASLTWVEQVVAHATSLAPPSRLVLGLAAYGYEWSPSQPSARGLTYGQAMARLRESGSTLRWHAQHRVPYFTTPEGSQVWLEDRFSAGYKLQLVHRYGLAGVAIWRLGQEDPGLWDVVTRVLGSRPSG